jgi:hypothetical protein
MAAQTAQDFITYYQNLLIIQYLGKTKARGTIAALITPVVMPQASLAVTTLPLAVQAAYDITSASPAIGKQLDVIGKYAGVSRYGYDFKGPVTLNDTDFLTLIKIAIIQNSANSSLSDIQALINDFFPGKMRVFDYLDMRMSYFMDPSAASLTLAEFFVEQGSLPKPMGVQLGSLIFSADIYEFYGWYSYPLVIAGAEPPLVNASPMNTYGAYNMDYPWLSYDLAISPNLSYGKLLTEDGIPLDTEFSETIITE